MSVVAWLSPKLSERTLARSLLLDIVGGIVDHGFELIDVTGNATTWGRWAPEYVNDYRGFSDERGLQSLQILAYRQQQSRFGGGAANLLVLKYDDAFKLLTNTTNQYHWNTLNQILTPCGDNYSDDELAWLPFFMAFMSPADPNNKIRM